MKITTKTIEQAALINTALGGDWQAISLAQPPRRQPGRSVRLVAQRRARPTSARSTIPEIDAPAGRRAGPKPIPAKQKTIYEDVNRVFGEQVYNLWFNWSEWNIASATDVFGVYGPDNAGREQAVPGPRDGALGRRSLGPAVIVGGARCEPGPTQIMSGGTSTVASAT